MCTHPVKLLLEMPKTEGGVQQVDGVEGVSTCRIRTTRRTSKSDYPRRHGARTHCSHPRRMQRSTLHVFFFLKQNGNNLCAHCVYRHQDFDHWSIGHRCCTNGDTARWVSP